jgi:hypothetical protein
VAADSTKITHSGTVLGTAAYMAPEQLEGDKAGPAGPAPDLREALPSAPEKAVAALRRGMDTDPAKRPGSAGELIKELERAFEERIEKTAAMPRVPKRRPEPAAAAPASPAPPAPPARPVARREPAMPAPRRRTRSRWPALAGLLAALLVAGLVAGLSLTGGGDGGSEKAADKAPADKPKAKKKKKKEPRDEKQPQQQADEPAPSQPAQPAASGGTQPVGQGGAAEGTRLNSQGYALMRQGRYEEAVPVLERAVKAFPAGSQDNAYYYALYNLGSSLRRSGRAGEAIPILERRLQFPDQRDVVQRELELAKREAGRG